jgi:hypothetical protein
MGAAPHANFESPSYDGGSAASSSPMFHVEPTAPDGLRSTTAEPQGPKQRSKGIARVETKMATRNACREMLTQIIAASPDVRTHLKYELLTMARQKWPDLSKRAFEQARLDAIRAVPNASAWSNSGAPPKSLRAKSPR